MPPGRIARTLTRCNASLEVQNATQQQRFRVDLSDYIAIDSKYLILSRYVLGEKQQCF